MKFPWYVPLITFWNMFVLVVFVWVIASVIVNTWGHIVVRNVQIVIFITRRTMSLQIWFFLQMGRNQPFTSNLSIPTGAYWVQKWYFDWKAKTEIATSKLHATPGMINLASFRPLRQTLAQMPDSRMIEEINPSWHVRIYRTLPMRTTKRNFNSSISNMKSAKNLCNVYEVQNLQAKSKIQKFTHKQKEKSSFERQFSEFDLKILSGISWCFTQIGTMN